MAWPQRADVNELKRHEGCEGLERLEGTGHLLEKHYKY